MVHDATRDRKSQVLLFIDNSGACTEVRNCVECIAEYGCINSNGENSLRLSYVLSVAIEESLMTKEEVFSLLL